MPRGVPGQSWASSGTHLGVNPKKGTVCGNQMSTAARQREENCRAQTGRPAGLKAQARAESA